MLPGRDEDIAGSARDLDLICAAAADFGGGDQSLSEAFYKIRILKWLSETGPAIHPSPRGRCAQT